MRWYRVPNRPERHFSREGIFTSGANIQHWSQSGDIYLILTKCLPATHIVDWIGDTIQVILEVHWPYPPEPGPILTPWRKSMKVVFIGADTRTAEMASLSVRLRWPDSAVIHATAAAQGLELVEREWPDIVLLHPDFSDMVLSGAIQALRGFSNVPLLVLGHQNDEMEAVSSLEI